MTDTILGKPPVTSGFRESVATWVRRWGEYSATAQTLASHIAHQPLYDPRLRQLLRLSPDSDKFDPSGGLTQTFMQRLVAQRQPPGDIDLIFNELVSTSTAGLAPVDESEIRNRIEAQYIAKYQSVNAENEQLTAELEKKDRKIAEQSQQLSDLRGELKAMEPGKVEALSRKIAELEGLLDLANRTPAKKRKRPAKKRPAKDAA